MNRNKLNYSFNDVDNINNIKTVSLDNIDNVKLNKENMNILSMNIRSFKAHIDELMLFLRCIENEFDVIVLSEIWLKEDFNIKIQGYKIVHSLGIINPTKTLR